MNGELIVALVALGGVIITQLVTLRQIRAEINQRHTEFTKNLEEAKRIEWKDYLIGLMERLIEARSEYEQFLGTDKKNLEMLAGIVGKANAVCMAADDAELARIVDEELTPYPADKQNDDGLNVDWASRNREALHEAVKRLAQIIRQS